MASFPTYPMLLFDDYDIDHGAGPDRTIFERGPGKQANKYTHQLEERRVRYGFKTHADWLSFLAFYKVTLNRGAGWFDWIEPVHGTVHTMRIKGRLKSVPIDIMTTKWDITFILEEYV